MKMGGEDLNCSLYSVLKIKADRKFRSEKKILWLEIWAQTVHCGRVAVEARKQVWLIRMFFSSHVGYQIMAG